MRIDVQPPASDARRDRVEREVFAQLTAARIADRVDAVVVSPRPSRMRYAVAAAALCAATIAIIVVATRHAPTQQAATPSLVVTPAGGTSRFTVGDAVIDAGSDTSVEVQHADDGAVTLVLGRGLVDCDVEPRAGRPPFRVVAGDVTVEVVGTRFAVARTPAVRVDVTRGKVRVTSPNGTSFVTAGESWPIPQHAAAPAAPIDSPAQEQPAELTIDDPATKRSSPSTRPATPDVVYKAAQRLESKDPAKAALAYRKVANGNDRWAAIALYSLAELHAGRDHAMALHDLAELARRFPHGANAEDAAWLRVDIVRASGSGDEVRVAAAAYLREFPTGTYAKSAARLVARP